MAMTFFPQTAGQRYPQTPGTQHMALSLWGLPGVGHFAVSAGKMLGAGTLGIPTNGTEMKAVLSGGVISAL